MSVCYVKDSIIDGYRAFAALHDGYKDEQKDEGNCNSNIRANVSDYPKNKRMVMFVDRRSKTWEDNKLHNFGDEVIFYDPPKGTNSLPDKQDYETILPESYYNTSQKCLIPRIGYNDGINEALITSKMNSLKRTQNSTISCKTACGGNLILFSFHIISSNIIKCYVWREGQFTRFFPQDIHYILPKIFKSELSTTKQFINDEKIHELISNVKFIDKQFEYWYNNKSA